MAHRFTRSRSLNTQLFHALASLHRLPRSAENELKNQLELVLATATQLGLIEKFPARLHDAAIATRDDRALQDLLGVSLEPCPFYLKTVAQICEDQLVLEQWASAALAIMRETTRGMFLLKVLCS